MHLQYEHVTEAFKSMIEPPSGHGRKEETRNGNVIRWGEGPVTVTFNDPRRRVLQNGYRRANPFFHLYEALWMLAGRNDVEPLTYYNSQMKEYTDDGKTLNGAYGYRWRHGYYVPLAKNQPWHSGINQIETLLNHLEVEPNSRRAVLSMWNPTDDLLKIGWSKDVVCNLNICFEIRDNELHMTVFNRSNDIAWGLLGANHVHFSILQEYMANCLRVDVGKYHHVTNNLHAYEDNHKAWNPRSWKAWEYKEYPAIYEYPLVGNKKVFDDELVLFVERNKNGEQMIKSDWTERFFADVAQPMLAAFHHHKKRDYKSACRWLERCKAEDWKTAGTYWIMERERWYDQDLEMKARYKPTTENKEPTN